MTESDYAPGETVTLSGREGTISYVLRHSYRETAYLVDFGLGACGPYIASTLRGDDGADE